MPAKTQTVTPATFVAAAPPAACLLAGEETQLLEELKSAARRRHQPEQRHSIDLDSPQPADYHLGQSKDMFGGGAPELFILSSTGAPNKEALKLIDHLNATISAPDCLMVVINDFTYQHKKAAWFAKLAEQFGGAYLCERQPAAKARAWIGKWSEEHGISLTDAAIALIAQQTEYNLFAAKQAVAKLALGAEYNGAAQDEDAARAVLADGAKYTVLDLSDAIYRADQQRILAILHCLRQDGAENVLIQWSVQSVLSNVAAQKEGKNVFIQRDATRHLAGKIGPNAMRYLTRQAAYADRVAKGVATGDFSSIITGIALRIAALAQGKKIALPAYLHEEDT